MSYYGNRHEERKRKENRMRYAVQYETQTGTIGLMIFTVEDDAAAQT
jgi:hypothetical protein